MTLVGLHFDHVATFSLHCAKYILVNTPLIKFMHVSINAIPLVLHIIYSNVSIYVSIQI